MIDTFTEKSNLPRRVASRRIPAQPTGVCEWLRSRADLRECFEATLFVTVRDDSAAGGFIYGFWRPQTNDHLLSIGAEGQRADISHLAIAVWGDTGRWGGVAVLFNSSAQAFGACSAGLPYRLGEWLA